MGEGRIQAVQILPLSCGSEKRGVTPASAHGPQSFLPGRAVCNFPSLEEWRKTCFGFGAGVKVVICYWLISLYFNVSVAKTAALLNVILGRSSFWESRSICFSEVA